MMAKQISQVTRIALVRQVQNEYSRFYNWGGTLFDLNGDNNLDLWLSRNSRNVPIVLLGDGTGKFSSDNYVEVYLPKNWPKVMRQFGYVIAADLEDDGFNEIFFSVQGDSRLSPNDCKGDKGLLRFLRWLF